MDHLARGSCINGRLDIAAREHRCEDRRPVRDASHGVKTRIPIVQTVGRYADYLRALRVGNRDRERGRIGDVAGRIAGTSQQRVAGVRRRGRVPTHAVGSGGVLGAEQGAIQVELHAGNADVVRDIGGKVTMPDRVPVGAVMATVGAVVLRVGNDARSDQPVAVQVLVETGFEQFQRRTGTRDDGRAGAIV